jgi:outer membrane autotransporter protein
LPTPPPLRLALPKAGLSLAALATVSLVLAEPVRAQTPFGTTTEPAAWIGGTGTNQWNNQNNWQTQSGAHAVPLLVANFTGLTNNRTVRDQNSQSIGTLNFTAPGYVLSLENGTVFIVNGTGFVINNPANRPIVDVGVVNGGTIRFTNASTGGLARFVIGPAGTLDTSLRTTTTGMTAGSIDNGGLINLANPDHSTVGNELTVFGSYFGRGGTIALNTFLGGDNSPSDKLVINGGTATIDGLATATGSTFLRVTNAGGPGDYTTNGIPVVVATNGGTTVPGAFTLAGEVRAGFFDYRLFRGGLNGGSPNDWFLRSDFLGGNGGNGGNGGGGPISPPGELPSDPAPDNGMPPPPGVWPIIGPELATYGVVQPIARQMGLTTLGTLHERVGDAAADAACLSATPYDGAITKAPPVSDNCRQAVWGRLFGQQIDNHYQAFADPRATGQVAGIQTGADIWRGSLIPGHSDTAGLYFAYGNGNVSVNGLVTNATATAYVLEHTGSLNLNAFSVGGYWTHYGPTGWYIDAVLQGSFYNGTATTQFANLPTNGTGFTSSLEAGYPIPVPWFGPRFVLEPEGQIIWQQVSFRDDNDGLGSVALGTTSGASGRLGLRGKWTINDPAGRVWQPYVLANVWRDWGAGANTMFGIDSAPLIEQATRLEFAGGLSAKILPGLSLYAQAGYQFATSGQLRRDGVKGDFGVHYSW